MFKKMKLLPLLVRNVLPFLARTWWAWLARTWWAWLAITWWAWLARTWWAWLARTWWAWLARTYIWSRVPWWQACTILFRCPTNLSSAAENGAQQAGWYPGGKPVQYCSDVPQTYPLLLYNTVPRRQDVIWRRRLSPIMLETYLNKCLTEVSTF